MTQARISTHCRSTAAFTADQERLLVAVVSPNEVFFQLYLLISILYFQGQLRVNAFFNLTRLVYKPCYIIY